MNKYKTKEILLFNNLNVDITINIIDDFFKINNDDNLYVGVNSILTEPKLTILYENIEYVERVEFKSLNNKWIEDDYKVVDRLNKIIKNE